MQATIAGHPSAQSTVHFYCTGLDLMKQLPLTMFAIDGVFDRLWSVRQQIDNSASSAGICSAEWIMSCLHYRK